MNLTDRVKTTWTGEYSRQFPREEAERYKGPVNYISMVEAFKTGSHATTPLRICMNSSMKQPKPSWVSLNNCLLRAGPPALADLSTVTLGIWEHKVAFTKDFSKFYQCMEADESAQHVRRILWRFEEGVGEPTIFVTTRVNYGDRPAGCSAIAAVRETASRFGEGKERLRGFSRTGCMWTTPLEGQAHREQRGRSHKTWKTSWKMGDSASRKLSCLETPLERIES
jgi:hypothetical protein